MQLRSLHEADLPRERLAARTASSLSSTELIAILLGSGSVGENALELSARILATCDLARLAAYSCAEFTAHKGIGTAKAARLVAAFELGRRATIHGISSRILAEQDAIAYARPLIGHLGQEHFLAIFLNTKNRVLGSEIVTKGLADISLIHPRELFRGAIARGASGVIVAHNHPSGDPVPSDEDIETTRLLEAAGQLLGIPLLDHVIVTANGGASIFKT